MKCNQRLIIIGGLAAFFWLVQSAAAAGGVGIMPQPTPAEPSRSWFVYTLKPGETKSDTAIINNNSEKSVTVAVEGLDAINTSDGGFTLIESTAQNQDLGNWVKLSANTIQIPAGDSAKVNFSLTVPNNASPGQHSGAIVIYEKSASSPDGIGLRLRVGARIYVTVPGTVTRKLVFQKASHEIKDRKLIFHITARNESNVNIEPALDINIRGLFGSYHQEENSNGVFLPNSTITIDKEWKKRAPLMGYYRVSMVLHTWSVDEILPDGSKKTLPDMTFKYSFGFWVGKIYFALLILLLIFGWLAYRLAIFWKDKNKYRTKVEIYTIAKGETIIHIAEKTGALPQLIVKFNRLVWPYALNVGDKLMVPIRPLTPDELYRKSQIELLPSVWSYLISFKSSLYHPRLTASSGPSSSSQTKSTRSRRKKR